MTKKTIIKILTPVLVAIPVVSALMPHVAQAGWFDNSVYTAFAFVTQAMLAVAGWFLSLAGVLLNGAMVATLNMKTIVDNTPAIGVAWRTIRDFSSIIIIFMLLYASINMILGRKDHNLGTLIKNVIIAGLLINFSLFGTKLVIDASNVISTSFYCAMVPVDTSPGTHPNFCNGGVSTTDISSSFTSSGIANVFMQSLDIQAVVSNGKTLVAGTDPHLSIALSNIGASILMIFAGFSFLAAALMFSLRLGILILLLAFSPIYCIAMMMPGSDVDKQAKIWLSALISMCLFMPVYLFLMYIAVSIINDPAFFNFARIPDTATNTGLLTGHTVGIFLQYMIAFIMINAPLVAAISVANEGVDVVGNIGKSIQKWGQGAVTGAARGSAGFLAQETAGRWTSKFRDSKFMSDQVRRNPNLAAIVDSAASKVTGAALLGTKGGYDKRVKDNTEALVKLSKKVGPSADQVAEFRGEMATKRLELITLDRTIEANRVAMRAAVTDAAKADLKEEGDKLKKDRENLKKEVDAGKDEDGIKKGAKNKALLEMSENLKGKFSITGPGDDGSKAAAKKIREELEKSKDKKLLDAIKEAGKDE